MYYYILLFMYVLRSIILYWIGIYLFVFSSVLHGNYNRTAENDIEFILVLRTYGLGGIILYEFINYAAYYTCVVDMWQLL